MFLLPFSVISNICSYILFLCTGVKFEATQGPYFKRADALAQSISIPATNSSSVKDIFQTFTNHITADIVQETQCIYLFDIDGDKWILDLKNGTGAIKQVDEYIDEDVKMTIGENVMTDICTGKLNATAAFMSGKLKIKGDLQKAMKLEKLISKLTVNSKL